MKVKIPSALIVKRIDPKSAEALHLIPGTIYTYQKEFNGFKYEDKVAETRHIIEPEWAIEMIIKGYLDLHVSKEEMVELQKSYNEFLVAEKQRFEEEMEDFEFKEQRTYDTILKAEEILKKYIEENE